MLLLCHPEVANRPCRLCADWLFDERTGEIDRDSQGQPLRRPPRGVLSVPPCRQPRGSCPKGTPQAKHSLSAENERAYRHYLECKAVGRFPDDAVVVEHAGRIRAVEEQVERNSQKLLRMLLEAALIRRPGL